MAGCIVGAVIATCGCRRTPEAKEASFLKHGEALVAKKDYPRAILEFQNAAHAAPTDAEPLYRMALALLETGDVASAVRALQRATALNPKHTGAQLKLAGLMTATRDPQLIGEAITRLKGSFGSSPDDPAATDTLALAQWKLGQPEDAKRQLSETLRRFPAHLESSVTLARMKLSSNDLAGAEEALRKAVAQAPQSPAAALALGDLYLYLRQPTKAESEFKRALELDPKSAPALISLASVQMAANRTDDAEETYKRLSALPEKTYRPVHALFLYNFGKREAALAEFEALANADKRDREARTRLVAAYFGLNRLPAADQVLEAALKRNPKDTDALLQRSELSLRLGKADDARRDLNSVIRFTPDSPSAHLLLARVYEAQHMANSVRGELQQALRLDPALLQARIALANDYLSAKQVQSAVDVLEQALPSQKVQVPWVIGRNWAMISQGNLKEARANSDRVLQLVRTPDAIYQNAVVRLLQNDYPGGQDQLEEMLKQNPGDLRAPELMMQVFDLQKEIPKGLDRLKQLASANRKSAPLQRLVGQWYMRTGNLNGARQAFEASLAADAHYLPAQMSLADLDMQAGYLDMARHELNAIIAANPQDVAALVLSARAEDSAGNHQAVIARYRAVLDVDSSNVIALNNLAYALADDNLDDALKYAQRAAELAPDAPFVQDTLGWIFYRKGLYTSAVGYLKAAIAKESTPKRQFHLGMSYLKAGEQANGKRIVEEALLKDPNLPKSEKRW